jgi:hypothetical protein
VHGCEHQRDSVLWRGGRGDRPAVGVLVDGKKYR